MPTKLSRYCEGVIEAAWLAALILIPTFFNIYSSRIFEPDKITLLRSLALLILGAWAIKLIAEGRVRWERLETGESRLKSILRIPFLLPVLALIVVYILASILSVTPRTSFWGSYQRLQGTYTTFSYLVVFAAMVSNLRKRAQVERLITTVVLTSLPVSLYGILQRYKLDPVPWGGDTSVRVAANMGNSIFVAAYLIMAFPLTIGRIVEAFRAILNEPGRLGSQVARGAFYVFIAAVQAITIFMTQSRGPWLGWMAGSFFLFVLLSLHWRKRWLTFSVVGAAALLAGFLVLINIPNGPLSALRSVPGVGRLGEVLDDQSRTGQVRVLIWEGAAKLVAPHDPIEFPDGKKDPFNALRTIVGYGPESMYVAYNPFYPPKLGTIEKRNASPDRSHNETWDTLVTTGVLGLLVYLALFASVFYYGLKWLGLIPSKRQRNLFFALYFGGGLIGAVGLIAFKGIEYFGVGLPFGIILGLIAYLALAAVFISRDAPRTPGESARSLTLIVILAAIMSHFVEINFGIAIVSTRTHFWVYAALLLVIGYILPHYGAYELPAPASNRPAAQPRADLKSSRKKGRRAEHSGGRPAVSRGPLWMREALIAAGILALLLFALGYDYVSNPTRLQSALGIISSSFTRLPNQSNALSFGILFLVFMSWLAGAVVLTAENTCVASASDWLKAFGVTLGASLLLGFLFWLAQASALAALTRFTPTNQAEVIQQVNQVGALLTRFYFFVFAVVLGTGFFLPEEWPVKARATTLAAAFAPAALLLVVWLISITNLRVVHADITYKMAEPFTRSNQWPVATILYRQAIRQAPDEDFYYLFLGRSYLEQAKTVQQPSDQQALVQQAEQDLKVAQKINPLNTDHTANLARLFSWWTSQATDQATLQQRGQKSSDYYSRAVVLSPNNPRLWDEWGILFLDTLKQPEEAYKRFSQAKEIDPTYDWTYTLIATYYIQESQKAADAQARDGMIRQGIANYEKALSLPNSQGNAAWIDMNLKLGGLYTELEQPDKAIAAYQEAIRLDPGQSNVWRINEAIAQLYAKKGDIPQALQYANQALSGAPDDQKERLQTFISQLQPLSQAP